jgi:hypothetical protein
MAAPTMVVGETTLPEFRQKNLSPEALFARLLSGDGVLLVGAPPGVGKTHAAHGIITHALAQGHDLVVYIAPTRALIGELLANDRISALREHSVVLERRPTDRCGDLNAEWSLLERSGCAALAKSTLCSACCHQDDCGWPDQFDRIDETTRLVVCTEAYLSISPGLIRRLVDAAGAKKTLVVFDEASFMATSQKRSVDLEEIRRFHQAVTDAQAHLGEDGDHLIGLLQALTILLDAREDLSAWPRITRFSMIGSTIAIQEAGQARFGGTFRFIGPDLIQMTSGSNAGRWYAEDAYHFVPVPDTRGCDVIVFSPYLPAQIVEERLQRPVRSGLPSAVFRHSQTRILNITDPVGALRTLSAEDHFSRVADVFTALVLRDRLLGRRPVLVTKKRLIPRLKRHVEELSAAMGCPLRCRTIQEIDASEGKDKDVVLINFGILGVNSLKDHDALYCVGGYYARQAQLDVTYNQLLPPEDQIDLTIRSDGGRRHVVAGSADLRSRYHARRAQAVLDMIERRVVLQAVGRVRPFTSPATVVLFQQDDLSDVLGDVETYDRLSQFRDALWIPTGAEMRRAALGDRLRSDHCDGVSYRSIAEKHGLPLSTVYKALAMPSLEDLLRRIKL